MEHLMRLDAEDSELDLEVSSRAASLHLTGTLGPRSAASLRIVLDALDGVPGPIDVDAADAGALDEHVVYVLGEAATRRRSLGLAPVRLDEVSARGLRDSHAGWLRRIG
ncbi:MAG: hypothetical protein ACRDWT_13505 [Jatrophihabitantaceae bacterium]